MKTYTRSELIIAMIKYNEANLEIPFLKEIDNSLNCAEMQIDYLLSLVDEN